MLDGAPGLYLVILAIAVFSFISRKKIVVRSTLLLPFVVFNSVLLVAALVQNGFGIEDQTQRIFLKFFVASICAVAFGGFDSHRVWDRFCGLMELVIAVSLITFVLMNTFPSQLQGYAFDAATGEIFQTWHWLGFARASDISKYGFVRNQSLFWEPGVFGVFILFSMLIRALVLRNSRRTLLYAAGILSTFSMGAILLYTGTIFILSLKSGRLSRSATGRFLGYCSLGLLLTGFVYAASAGVDGVLRALSFVFSRDLYSDTSVLVRSTDITVGLSAAMQAPWFGHGWDFSDFYAESTLLAGFSKEAYGGGITNSLVAIFYQYGVIFLVLYLSLVYRACSRLAARDALILFAVVVGCLMIEPLFASVFFLLFAMYGRISVDVADVQSGRAAAR